MPQPQARALAAPAAVALAAPDQACLAEAAGSPEAYEACVLRRSSSTLAGLGPARASEGPAPQAALPLLPPAAVLSEAAGDPALWVSYVDGGRPRRSAQADAAAAVEPSRKAPARLPRGAKRGSVAAAAPVLPVAPSHHAAAIGPVAPQASLSSRAAELWEAVVAYCKAAYQKLRALMSGGRAEPAPEPAPAPVQDIQPAPTVPPPAVVKKRRPAAPAKKRRAAEPPPAKAEEQPAAERTPAPETAAEAAAEPEKVSRPPEESRPEEKAAAAPEASPEPRKETAPQPPPPPPQKPPEADLGPAPAFAPGDLGTGVYDVLSWGFWDGDSKAVLDMARKEVAETAREFSRNLSPALASALKRLFLQLEHGTDTGLEAKLRLEITLPDWDRTGPSCARYLLAVDEARKAIEGVLARYSGLFYDAAGIELEARLLDIALSSGAGSVPLEKRREALSRQQANLQAQMRRAIGREKDFSGIVSAEDEAYLKALAKQTGPGFLADPRTKRWLMERVEAVTQAIEFQVKRKSALEALKMALLAEKDLDKDQKDVLEDFLRLTREGAPASSAIESATDSETLRQAVKESQTEFAGTSVAGSQLQLARSLERLAVLGVIPSLNVGVEEGLKEGYGLGKPGIGVQVRWAVTSALRLLWSNADLRVPQLEGEIAQLNVVQASRDKAYNFERAASAMKRWAEKAALDGGLPSAEDIALYGRARQVYSYSPDLAATQALAAQVDVSSAAAVSDLKGLVQFTLENSPLARIAKLRVDQSEAEVENSGKRIKVEAGFSAGTVVLDSLLPSLVVTLENLGRQKAAALVKQLASSLQEAKTVFELTYAMLHDANDYLFALQALEDAELAVRAASAAGDKAAVQAAETRRIEAAYRVGQVEAELRRLLGPGTPLPSRQALAEMFSRERDQLYWGNPLFKNFNMDATLNYAAQRVCEDLVATQQALTAVPELKIHLSSIFAMLLAPAMPWMSVLIISDIARTALPLLSRLLSSIFPGKAGAEREARLSEVYGRLWENQRSAQALGEEFMRQREELKTMGAEVTDSPRSGEEAHQFNRWRIAALAYDIAPGAEDFLADRVVSLAEAGRLEEAAALWRLSHAARKLEPFGKPSRAGELLRRKLDEDAAFKEKLAERILDADDWFEAKLLLDPWLKDFGLDFGPKLGGKLVKKIAVKRYFNFLKTGKAEAAEAEPKAAEELQAAVDDKDWAKAYELYKARAGAPAGKPEAVMKEEELQDPAKQRALAKRIIAVVRSGGYDRGQELLAAAEANYGAAGLDFEKHYPGLKSWVKDWVARDATAEAARPRLSWRLELPAWLHEGVRGPADASLKLQEPRRFFRLIPEWDFSSGWSSVSAGETMFDREHGISENLTVTRENYQGTELERRYYSFSGPMGPLGDLRFNTSGSLYWTRERPWNPFSPITESSSQKPDFAASLALTQRGLLPGHDLTERFVHRLLSDGSRRDEYSLGVSGLSHGSYNFADVTLLRDDPAQGQPRDHFRTYGRLGYGREDDPFHTALKWQADDMYGYRQDSPSGELNLSGGYRPSLFDGRQTDLVFSGTMYRNRSLLTGGRYYSDTYTKDASSPLPLEGDGTARPDGAVGYAGLRQLLVDGKYGGIGMGYAVQSETGAAPKQYRTVTYLAPGGRGQVDVINSDDPSVGSLAVQAQANAGPAMLRVGVDASSYTAAVGLRDPSGALSATARLSVGVEDTSSRAWGAALSTYDSSYQALWANHGRDFAVSVSQGDWWNGNGIQFDFRKSYTGAERLRLKMSLSSFTEASDWTKFVPFAPLAKGIYESVSSIVAKPEGLDKPKVATDLGSAVSREDLARKAADILEKSAGQARGDENSLRAAAFINDAANGMSDDYNSFRQQANTAIPYSWKPAFQEFLTGLAELIPQLRQAQSGLLWERSDRLEHASFAWTPRIADMLGDVLQKYEAYRAAYREQIWAIPVSGGVDRRPDHIAAFNKRSQWFVDYVELIKAEFLEMDRIGKLSKEDLQAQLAALQRLREGTRLDEAAVPSRKALEFLGPAEWLPTSTDVPIRVLDSRMSRLLAEKRRRDAEQEREEKLRRRAAQTQDHNTEQTPKP
ncbi:MAG: hypothetical protein HY926_10745 [Elusimicrobia bacterium]|nr:hypothetical protein [Elusimicrobiota bacterium]